jgi:hypothetical protein
MILMYDYLLDFCEDKDDIKDAFYRLQSLSCNELLPMFRALIYKDSDMPTNNKLIDKFNEFSALANDISSGNIDPQKINSILGSLNLSMLSGAFLGALGTILTKDIKKDNKE